nr:hypothetical protein CFP56_24425 [Quercus suber]
MKFRRTSFTISNPRNEQRKQQIVLASPGIDREYVDSSEHGFSGEGCLPLRMNKTPTFNMIEERFNSYDRPAARKHSMSTFFRGLKSKDTSHLLQGVERDCPRPITSHQSDRLKVGLSSMKDVCNDKARCADIQSKRSASKFRSRPRLSFDISADAEHLACPPKDHHIFTTENNTSPLKHRGRPTVPPIDVSLASPPSSASAKPSVQHARSPVCRQELIAMFRGAPYFSIDKATLTPKVSFVENGEAFSVENNLDHREYSSTAFAASTMAIDGFRSLEVPNMLSANGLDPGTVGFEYFLQLPIADPPKQGDDEDELRMEKRRSLGSHPEKFGLRTLESSAIAERLAALETTYADLRKSTATHLGEQHDFEKQWSEDKIEEMGERLFTELIDAELGISAAGTGSVMMSTQIEALLKVLGQADLWYDFSLTGTRLQLGQILFKGGHSRTDQPSDRDLLLVQITVAAELLIRLQAVKVFDFSDIISNAELERLKAQMCTSTAWNLLLAERFLENLGISGSKQANSILPFTDTPLSSTAISVPDGGILQFPNLLHNAGSIVRQKAALLDFAATIRWPHLDDVKTHFTESGTIREPLSYAAGLMPSELSAHRPVSGMTIYHTPPSTPGCSPSLPALSPTQSNRSDHSYLSADNSAPPSKQQEFTAPKLTINVTQTAAIDPAQIKLDPWISQHWLSGLVLPGGSTSDLLMGTLLESSPPSLWTLGHLANLHSGFVYKNQGFWSQKSVAGRVLAAAEGVVESMGWISIPSSLLSNVDDGWVHIEAEALSDRDHVPRVKHKDAVSKASDPLHGQSETAVQAADFTTPTDTPPIMGNETRLDGLSFKTDAYGPATAQLTFSSPTNAKAAPVIVPLIHDVHFIASYPCQPPPPLPSPTTLTRSLTGSQHTNRPVSPVSRRHPLPASQRAMSTRSHTILSRPRTGGSLPIRTASTALRTSRSISGMALTSRPNTFHETVTHTIPSDAIKSRQPSPPILNHEPAIDKSVTPGRTTPKAPNALTLDLALPFPAAHPLHIGYTYTIVGAATILASSPETLDAHEVPVDLGEAGNMPTAGRRASLDDNNVEQEIMVLDCRGSADLEVLARAWCSKIGEHAVIGKVGRTCLACCVREARGLGVGVVIRV